MPGPGRYEAKLDAIKKKAPSYYLGEKIQSNSLKLMVGTNKDVGPGTYKPENSKKTSVHQNGPVYSLQKAKRKGLQLTKWTIQECYYDYSSIGGQVMSKKRSESRVNIGKASKDQTAKLGMFKAQMSKVPTKVSIPHPKL